jgi:hypothetical protein
VERADPVVRQFIDGGLRRRAGTSTGSRGPASASPCVRFKKLADLDEKALVALVKETARMGLAA